MGKGYYRIRASRLGFAGRLAGSVIGFLTKDRLLAILLVLYAVMALVFPGYLEESLRLPDYGALLSITALIMGSSLLDTSGLLQEVMRRLRQSTSPKAAPVILVLASGLLAAILMNDAAVFIAAPAAASLAIGDDRARARLVSLSLISVNVGSALTPYGNPQDIIMVHRCHITPGEYASFVAPVYTPTLLLVAILAASVKAEIARGPSIMVDRRRAIKGVIVTVLGALSVLFHNPLPAILGIVTAMVPSARQALTWDLVLVAQIALFYMTAGYMASHGRISLTSSVTTYLTGYALSLLVSNVPATIALQGAPWKPLHLAVNLAGVAHPYSSLANLAGLRITNTSWKDYLRYTLPITSALFIVGLATLYCS